jgi:hypothetical protein
MMSGPLVLSAGNNSAAPTPLHALDHAVTAVATVVTLFPDLETSRQPPLDPRLDILTPLSQVI